MGNTIILILVAAGMFAIIGGITLIINRKTTSKAAHA